MDDASGRPAIALRAMPGCDTSNDPVDFRMRLASLENPARMLVQMRRNYLDPRSTRFGFLIESGSAEYTTDYELNWLGSCRLASGYYPKSCRATLSYNYATIFTILRRNHRPLCRRIWFDLGRNVRRKSALSPSSPLLRRTGLDLRDTKLRARLCAGSSAAARLGSPAPCANEWERRLRPAYQA
jgi:hypothetical protein